LSYCSAGPEEKVITSLDIIPEKSDAPTSPIPRRKKALPQSNGHATNGTVTNGGSATKRTADEAFIDESPSAKKAKIQSNGASDDIIVIEDTDGAILID
jgi:ubiquitin-like 1-activating enzyme E1 B